MGQVNVNSGGGDGDAAAAAGMGTGMMLMLIIGLVVLLLIAFFVLRPLFGFGGGSTTTNVTIRSLDSLVDSVRYFV